MHFYNTFSSLLFIQLANSITGPKEAHDFNKTIDLILRKSNSTTEIDDGIVLSELIDNNTDVGLGFDVNLFESNNLKNVVKIAKSKHKLVETEFNNTLRYIYEKYHEAYWEYTWVVNKTIDLMTQSVYATRYRLQDTKPIRKEYANDFRYKIAIMYGTLMQLRLKMDNIYASLRSLGPVKFIFYMTLYERVVMATVDVDSLVSRIFAVYSEHYKSIKRI